MYIIVKTNVSSFVFFGNRTIGLLAERVNFKCTPCFKPYYIVFDFAFPKTTLVDFQFSIVTAKLIVS